MACGCPTVTSNAASLPEVVGQAGLMANPHDVDAFAVHMSRILNDPALAASLRERGLKQAARFTWQAAADQTLAIYRRVLEQAAQGT
jgi:glycosyltransferase involved in cell wall biosynthesis